MASNTGSTNKNNNNNSYQQEYGVNMASSNVLTVDRDSKRKKDISYLNLLII
jgi:hypothetical protein